MTSNVTILTKKLESLPENSREKIAKYISEHFEELKDEMLWDEQFQKTSPRLSEMARKVNLMALEKIELNKRIKDYKQNPNDVTEWETLKKNLLNTNKLSDK